MKPYTVISPLNEGLHHVSSKFKQAYYALGGALVIMWNSVSLLKNGFFLHSEERKFVNRLLLGEAMAFLVFRSMSIRLNRRQRSGKLRITLVKSIRILKVCTSFDAGIVCASWNNFICRKHAGKARKLVLNYFSLHSAFVPSSYIYILTVGLVTVCTIHITQTQCQTPVVPCNRTKSIILIYRSN